MARPRCRKIVELNAETPEEQRSRLRFAMHYGQVDPVEGDREGPNVSYTFRLEGISAASLKDAYDPMRSEDFPDHDYAILSQAVVEILQARQVSCTWKKIGVLPLKGFDGYHQLYLLRDLSTMRFETTC